MENFSTLNANIDFVSDIELEDEVYTPRELMEDDDNRPATPDELIEAANFAMKNLLPTKSNEKYEQAFNSFEQWKEAILKMLAI